MSGEGDLLRIGEAAEILGLDARRIYDAIDSGELPATHVEGHGVRVSRADVEAYAGSH